jgi:hypothetical protein
MPVSSLSRNACATSTYSCDHDARRHIGAADSSNAPARSTARISASTRFQRPAALKRPVDHRIERALVVEHAAHDAAEERGLGRQILRAFDLAADPVALELGEDLVERRCGDVHLVKRLHRRKPRCAAPVRLAVLARLGGSSRRLRRACA